MNPTDTADLPIDLINPYHAILFANDLFSADEPVLLKEDWVLANAKLIHEQGAIYWLEQLLKNLKTNEPTEDVTKLLMNPRRTVIFADSLQGEHELTMTEAVWQAENSKLMESLGREAWLWQLLEVLETGGTTSS